MLRRCLRVISDIFRRYAKRCRYCFYYASRLDGYAFSYAAYMLLLLLLLILPLLLLMARYILLILAADISLMPSRDAFSCRHAMARFMLFHAIHMLMFIVIFAISPPLIDDYYAMLMPPPPMFIAAVSCLHVAAAAILRRHYATSFSSLHMPCHAAYADVIITLIIDAMIYAPLFRFSPLMPLRCHFHTAFFAAGCCMPLLPCYFPPCFRLRCHIAYICRHSLLCFSCFVAVHVVCHHTLPTTSRIRACH